jgi:hypothetical protein
LGVPSFDIPGPDNVPLRTTDRGPLDVRFSPSCHAASPVPGVLGPASAPGVFPREAERCKTAGSLLPILPPPRLELSPSTWFDPEWRSVFRRLAGRFFSVFLDELRCCVAAASILFQSSRSPPQPPPPPVHLPPAKSSARSRAAVPVVHRPACRANPDTQRILLVGSPCLVVALSHCTSCNHYRGSPGLSPQLGKGMTSTALTAASLCHTCNR